MLRLPGFSAIKDIFKGSRGTIPLVTLSNKCICCNKETTYKETIDPVAQNQRLEKPFKVPVCLDCSKHAIVDRHSLSNYVFLAMLGIGFAIYEIVHLCGGGGQKLYNLDAHLFILVLSILVAALAIFLLYRSNNKKNIKIPGHCHGANFYSHSDKELIIETGNKRIVEEILENNSNIVWHISTTAEPWPIKVKIDG